MILPIYTHQLMFPSYSMHYTFRDAPLPMFWDDRFHNEVKRSRLHNDVAHVHSPQIWMSNTQQFPRYCLYMILKVKPIVMARSKSIWTPPWWYRSTISNDPAMLNPTILRLMAFEILLRKDFETCIKVKSSFDFEVKHRQPLTNGPTKYLHAVLHMFISG